MNIRRITVALSAAALLAGASVAWAHGGRGGGHRGGGAGFVVGAALGAAILAPRIYYPPRAYYGPAPIYYAPWPGYGASFHYGYPPAYPAAYPPAVVAVPQSPPVYIERAPSAAAPQQQYWYWCADPQGYYPTVRECAGGWQQVLPESQGAPR